MALLEPTKNNEVVETLVRLDGVTPSALKVSDHSLTNHSNNFSFDYTVPPFKVCCEVYDSLVNGDYGAQGKNAAPGYHQACHAIFKYAAKFKPATTHSKDANDKVLKEISEDIEP